MATKITVATMGCAKNEPLKIIKRGFSVRDGIYEYETEFATPVVTRVIFEAKLEKANSDQINVKTVGVVVRDASSFDLFGILDLLCLYTNGLYKGKPEKLKLSGFGLSSDPSPHGIAAIPVIDRIVKGGFTLSMKIHLVKKTGGEVAKREKVNYIVQVAVAGTDPLVWKTVLETSNSRKLLILDCVEGKKLMVRIAKSNAAGQSDWSSPVSYIPQ